MNNRNFTSRIVQTVNQFKLLTSFNNMYIHYTDAFVNKPLLI